MAWEGSTFRRGFIANLKNVFASFHLMIIKGWKIIAKSSIKKFLQSPCKMCFFIKLYHVVCYFDFLSFYLDDAFPFHTYPFYGSSHHVMLVWYLQHCELLERTLISQFCTTATAPAILQQPAHSRQQKCQNVINY